MTPLRDYALRKMSGSNSSNNRGGHISIRRRNFFEPPPPPAQSASAAEAPTQSPLVQSNSHETLQPLPSQPKAGSSKESASQQHPAPAPTNININASSESRLRPGMPAFGGAPRAPSGSTLDQLRATSSQIPRASPSQTYPSTHIRHSQARESRARHHQGRPSESDDDEDEDEDEDENEDLETAQRKHRSTRSAPANIGDNIPARGEQGISTLIEVTRNLGTQVEGLTSALMKGKLRAQGDGSSESEPTSLPPKKLYKGPVRQKHLELKRRIRAVLARLEHRDIKSKQSDTDNGFLPPLTNEQLLNFQNHPIEFGPTRQDFRLCYDQKPKSDWNTAASQIILDVLFETYPDTKESRDLVANKIWIHVRGRHQKYVLSTRDPEENAARVVRNRRRGRRLDLFNRRWQALNTSVVLQRSFRHIILRLGSEGMSGDETDPEAISPQYLIHRRPERSQQLTTFLRDLDVLHIIRTHYDNHGNRKPGNFPNDRYESLIRSDAAPIPSLPQACYGSAWLATLRGAGNLETPSLQEIDLNVDYKSDLSYSSLCLPPPLQEYADFIVAAYARANADISREITRFWTRRTSKT
ncbi:hypothetical protein SISNIDRAFT_464704 [Sistotremastrum niveocremeum HHB9708]|uniref:Uncharacterized protein n=1 Tax=Sistotremastrum niveocremeum HHB9708 TaxID=1314777 RepID=A0A164WGP3_9AGAM|nr:hypothetical protein SISNIDRAFT_464704 [Sistotremastrum niveocremeum HHB9708]